MSIEKLGAVYSPVCDHCGEELPAEFDFYDAVAAKKIAGWKSRRIGDEWEDICTDCQAEENDPKNIFSRG